MNRFLLPTFIALMTLANGLAAQNNWTGFQNGGHVSLSGEEYPVTWTPQQGIAWKVELVGYGQSSPVVMDDQIYVTSVAGDMKDQWHVAALRLSDGKELWQHQFKNSTPEKNTSYVSRAAVSPVCDSSGVIAGFEGGNLVALSPDGSVRWQRDLVADYGPITARHGLGSSLEQSQHRVFVWIQREKDPYVLALSKETGETVWKSPGLSTTSWSSPRLIPVGEKQHLVLSGIGQLAGYDPTSGKRLWSFDDISNNSTPTPALVAPGRFLIGATDARGQSSGGPAAESNGVIEIKSGESGFEANFLWRAEKATCSFGSPISHGESAYFVSRVGAVYCLDAVSGEQRYVARTPVSTWATPIVIDSRIYLFGKDGTTTVLRTGTQFEKLAENRLWESGPAPAGPFGGPVLYAAVATGGRFLLRRGDTLFCVGK